MINMQTRHISQTSPLPTRSPNDDTKHNLIADTHIRPYSGLASPLNKMTTWAQNQIQAGSIPVVPQVEQHQQHSQLSQHLNATIYDVSAFGTVPDLIDHRIQVGQNDASFLVTDLTTVVEQFD